MRHPGTKPHLIEWAGDEPEIYFWDANSKARREESKTLSSPMCHLCAAHGDSPMIWSGVVGAHGKWAHTKCLDGSAAEVLIAILSRSIVQGSDPFYWPEEVADEQQDH